MKKNPYFGPASFAWKTSFALVLLKISEGKKLGQGIPLYKFLKKRRQDLILIYICQLQLIPLEQFSILK